VAGALLQRLESHRWLRVSAVVLDCAPSRFAVWLSSSGSSADRPRGTSRVKLKVGVVVVVGGEREGEGDRFHRGPRSVAQLTGSPSGCGGVVRLPAIITPPTDNQWTCVSRTTPNVFAAFPCLPPVRAWGAGLHLRRHRHHPGRAVGRLGPPARPQGGRPPLVLALRVGKTFPWREVGSPFTRLHARVAPSEACAPVRGETIGSARAPGPVPQSARPAAAGGRGPRAPVHPGRRGFL